MANSLGTDILIQAQDPGSTASFYVRHLGFKMTDETPQMISLHGDHIVFFIEQGPLCPGSHCCECRESQTPACGKGLRDSRCEIVKDEPDFPRCYVKDPFGLIYNLITASE